MMIRKITIFILFVCTFINGSCKIYYKTSPEINNDDTIVLNCKIISSHPRHRIIQNLAICLNDSDTISIVTDKNKSNILNIGYVYKLSLVKVKAFRYKITGNGNLLQITFDDEDIIYYINKVHPPLYILSDILERNEYYPYGGLINASDNQLQPYKYSSKELDRENGLDLYDSQARWYDPMLPQTTTQDPLAEKYYSISPYTWCAGNPIYNVDNDGKIIETAWDICNVIYDVGAATYNHITGNHKEAISNWVDFGTDVLAVIIPGLPAGTSKVFKGGKEVVESINKTKDAGKVSLKKGNLFINGSGKSQKISQPKNSKINTVTFTQRNGSKAIRVTTGIPKGYRKINELSHGNPVYTNGKNFITPDVDGHNGGVWKMGKSVKSLQNKSTRMGTYDEHLKRIGD